MQPVLGEAAEGANETDLRFSDACGNLSGRSFIYGSQFLSGGGRWTIYHRSGDYRTGSYLFKYHTIYISVFCGDDFTFGGSQERRNGKNSVLAFCYDFLRQLRTEFASDIRTVWVSGAAGAAVGTLCARITECAALIVYVAKKEKNLRIRLSDYFQIDRVLFIDYFRITGPILLVQTLWGLNTALQTVILGHMTSAAIAANSVASTLFLLVKSAVVGSSAAASVIIGKAIGAGDMEKVRLYSRLMQRIFLAVGAVGGLLLFFIRIPVLQLYSLSPDTLRMADQFLVILSVIFVGMSYQMPTNNGIIRGGGNPMFVVKMDLVSIWMIVLPLSFVMAFVVQAPPAVVVCCLNADQILKCVPGYLMSHYGNWIRKLTRDSYVCAAGKKRRTH